MLTSKIYIYIYTLSTYVQISEYKNFVKNFFEFLKNSIDSDD